MGCAQNTQRVQGRAVNLTRLQIWRISLSRPAITKRLTEASHQGQIHGFSGEGGRTLNSTRNNVNAKHFRFSCQKVQSTTNVKLRQLSGRLQTQIWRPGDTVQNLETPGLSRRVDRPEIKDTIYTVHVITSVSRYFAFTD